MLNRKEKRVCQRMNKLSMHTESTRSSNSLFRKISIVFLLVSCLLLSLSAFGVNAESAIVGDDGIVDELVNPEYQRVFDMDLRSICFEVYGTFGWQGYDTAIIQVDPPVFNSVNNYVSPEWEITQYMEDLDGNALMDTAYVEWFDWGAFEVDTPRQWHSLECTVTFEDAYGLVPPAPCDFYAYFGDSYINQYTFMDIHFIQDYDVGITANVFNISYRAYWIEDGQLRYNSYFEQVALETETGDYEAVLSIVTDNMQEIVEEHGEAFVTDLVVYGHALSSQIVIEGSEKQYGEQNFSDWIQLRGITADPTKIDTEIPSILDWLARAVTGILSIPIFGDFTLGAILTVIVAVTTVLTFLKFFAGG